MDHLGAIRSFLQVVDEGSLTRAADTLDLSRAMVSRHVEALERWLGARLLHRTTRQLSLSEAGQELLPLLRQMQALATDVQALSGSRSAEPTGKLRVTTSTSFAIEQLTRAVVEFQQHHPRIQVELLAQDRAVDLVAERIDIAIRITNRLDEGLVARRLASCRSVLCASPAYLARRGWPQTPADLRLHDCITHAFGSRAEYRLTRNGQPVRVEVTGPLSCNETALLREAAIAGAGIAMLPTYFVAEALRAGALVRVLDDHEPEHFGIHAVYLSRQHPPVALRLLIDFLAERFASAAGAWDAQVLQGA